MASLIPTVAVEVELSGVGGGWTDLRAGNDVFAGAGLTITHGIQGSSPIDRVANTGTATFALRNGTFNSAATLGYYSPQHASVRAGWGLGIGCRVRITDPATATIWTRFIGRIDAIDPIPGLKGERIVNVMAVDWLDEAARFSIPADIGEQVNQSWDGILTAIVAEVPVAPTATNYDSGTESYPYALDTSANARQKALSEFKKLADSEAGFIFLTAAGTLRAENRHVRMTNVTSVWTLTGTEYQALELPSTRDDIINTVRVTTHPKVVDATATHIVYRQANVIEFAAGQTKLLLGPYRDDDTGETIGATDVQPLVAGVDFTANTNSDGSGTDVSTDVSIVQTFGPSGAKFNVTNNGAVQAYLTSLVLTGKRILDHGTNTLEATDATSITTHGEHAVDFDMSYQANDNVGQGAADYLLAKFKDPLAQARTITVIGRTSALLTQILTRDISDRITLSETVTGVSDDFFINGMELVVKPSGHVQATYILTPAQDPFAGLYWILGTSTLGTNTTPAPF